MFVCFFISYHSNIATVLFLVPQSLLFPPFPLHGSLLPCPLLLVPRPSSIVLFPCPLSLVPVLFHVFSPLLSLFMLTDYSIIYFTHPFLRFCLSLSLSSLLHVPLVSPFLSVMSSSLSSVSLPFPFSCFPCFSFLLHSLPFNPTFLYPFLPLLVFLCFFFPLCPHSLHSTLLLFSTPFPFSGSR